MTPFVAELVGTFVLIVLGCGVNANVSLKGTLHLVPTMNGCSSVLVGPLLYFVV